MPQTINLIRVEKTYYLTKDYSLAFFYFTLLKNNVLLVLNLKPFWAEKLLT